MITQDVMIVSKGILIVGYGTRQGNLEQILEIQKKRLSCRQFDIVEIAYFRISKPTIQDAVKSMVAKGVDEIIAIPYFIAEGKLTKIMIPEKLGITGECGVANVDGKEVLIQVAPAFGVSYALTEIILDRIAAAGGDKDSGILILGHGTLYAAKTNMHIVKLNADRIRAIGFKHVQYSFNEFCEPSIKEALDCLEKQGVKKIVTVPLFIAKGIHLGEEIPEQLGIPAFSNGGTIKVNGREIDLAYTDPMDADQRLTDLLVRTAKHYMGE
jgi:sirohydrochlorin cobaltochelatase